MSVMLIALSIYMRMGQLGVNLLRSPLMRLPRYSMIMEVATMMRTLMMLLARKVIQPRKYALNSELCLDIRKSNQEIYLNVRNLGMLKDSIQNQTDSIAYRRLVSVIRCLNSNTHLCDYPHESEKRQPVC